MEPNQICNVAEIVGRILPSSCVLSESARRRIECCVTEFANSVCSVSSAACLSEGSASLRGDHVLFALEAMGYTDFISPLSDYHLKLKSRVQEKRPRSSGNGGGSKKQAKKMIPEDVKYKKKCIAYDLFSKNNRYEEGFYPPFGLNR